MKYLVLDLGGTLFRRVFFHRWIQEMVELEFLPQVAGEVISIAETAYQDRKIPFGEFNRSLVRSLLYGKKLWGLSPDNILEAGMRVTEKYGERTHVFPTKLLRLAKEAEYQTAIITGSPRLGVLPFARLHGIDVVLGSECPTTPDGRLTGDWDDSVVRDKAAAIRSLDRIDLDSSIAIGDTLNDVPMLQEVGYPIAFNPNTELMVEAKRHLFPVVTEQKCIRVDGFDPIYRRRREIPLLPVVGERRPVLPPELGKPLAIELAVEDLLP